MRFTSLVLALAAVAVLSGAGRTQTGITIESVTNVTDDSTLAGGMTHAVILRYDLSAAPGDFYWPANAWIIYSPDGADWQFVQGQTLPAFNAIGWPYLFINHFDKTGGTGSFGNPHASGGGNVTGVDTVGVLLAALFATPGNGLPAGFIAPAFQIEFGSSPDEDGLHICIDTSRQVPGGSWEWANPSGLIIPDWADSRCWVIGCCAGMVGNVDGSAEDVPTISDIAMLIDHLFGAQEPVTCLEEADVDQSGTLVSPPLDPTDVTIGDISRLVDFLFLSQQPLPTCP